MIAQDKILIYMDDVLIATEEIDEHLAILREIFEKARNHNLRFRLDKCRFLYDKHGNTK